jgi:hypothetical protein
MFDFVALLSAIALIAAVGFSLTLLGAYALVWFTKVLDRWLE